MTPQAMRGSATESNSFRPTRGGTIVNVSRDGDYCQVLWDSTGLIGTYNTGHAGAYYLMLWTTRERLLQALLAIPDRTRRTLHDDLLWCAPP